MFNEYIDDEKLAGVDDALDMDSAIDIIARESERNIERLQAKFKKTSSDKPLETLFMKNMEDISYKISHFSNTDFVTPEDGSVEFLSSHQLQARGIGYAESNTEELDHSMLATDQFVFFSLGVGNGAEKTKSRFGNLAYRANLEALGGRYENSLLQTHDILEPLERGNISQAKRDLFSPADLKEYRMGLKRNFDGDEGKATVGSIYYGKDIKEGLTLSVVNDFRLMSEGTRENLQVSIALDPNSVVQTFYRPQLLVPAGITFPKGKFTLTAMSH